jgi:hypothetical protein
LLDSVPDGVTTWTLPVVAPVGTAAVMSDGKTTFNVAVPSRRMKPWEDGPSLPFSHRSKPNATVKRMALSGSVRNIGR